MQLACLEENFERIKRTYEEISLDNTMKLLLRCKRGYHVLGLLVDILHKIHVRERDRKQLKELLEKSELLGTKEDELEDEKKQERRRKELRMTMEQMQSISDQSLLVARRIRQMQDEHKQLQRLFVFDRKEFVGYMKRDLENLKEQFDKKGIEIEGLEKTIEEVSAFAADTALRFSS